MNQLFTNALSLFRVKFNHPFSLLLIGVLYFQLAILPSSSREPSPEMTCKVLDVEDPLGTWSGYVEVDQWISVLVTESTDSRFKPGHRYRIGVPVSPGPLFEKDSPRFSPSVVSRGKKLFVDVTSDCVGPTDQPMSFKFRAQCIKPI